eukprot:155226-Pyramimonas_sp.AAC.1
MNVWGPSKYRPSHSLVVERWGGHFALPVVRGEPEAKANVVTQALTGEALTRHHDRNKEQE